MPNQQEMKKTGKYELENLGTKLRLLTSKNPKYS
jgi:hypothetical protein